MHAHTHTKTLGMRRWIMQVSPHLALSASDFGAKQGEEVMTNYKTDQQTKTVKHKPTG